MNRRSFLKGLVAGAAGLLLPADVAAEPERRVWALDATMLRREMDRYQAAPPERRYGDYTMFPRKLTIGDFAIADEPGLLTEADLHGALSEVWEMAEPLPHHVVVILLGPAPDSERT